MTDTPGESAQIPVVVSLANNTYSVAAEGIKLGFADAPQIRSEKPLKRQAAALETSNCELSVPGNDGMYALFALKASTLGLYAPQGSLCAATSSTVTECSVPGSQRTHLIRDPYDSAAECDASIQAPEGARCYDEQRFRGSPGTAVLTASAERFAAASAAECVLQCMKMLFPLCTSPTVFPLVPSETRYL
jgi:hypothetical protein